MKGIIIIKYDCEIRKKRKTLVVHSHELLMNSSWCGLVQYRLYAFTLTSGTCECVNEYPTYGNWNVHVK